MKLQNLLITTSCQFELMYLKILTDDDPYDPNLLIEFFQAEIYPSFLS